MAWVMLNGRLLDSASRFGAVARFLVVLMALSCVAAARVFLYPGRNRHAKATIALLDSGNRTR
jgi:hypothetical protein